MDNLPDLLRDYADRIENGDIDIECFQVNRDIVDCSMPDKQDSVLIYSGCFTVQIDMQEKGWTVT